MSLELVLLQFSMATHIFSACQHQQWESTVLSLVHVRLSAHIRMLGEYSRGGALDWSGACCYWEGGLECSRISCCREGSWNRVENWANWRSRKRPEKKVVKKSKSTQTDCWKKEADECSCVCNSLTCLVSGVHTRSFFFFLFKITRHMRSLGGWCSSKELPLKVKREVGNRFVLLSFCPEWKHFCEATEVSVCCASRHTGGRCRRGRNRGLAMMF